MKKRVVYDESVCLLRWDYLGRYDVEDEGWQNPENSTRAPSYLFEVNNRAVRVSAHTTIPFRSMESRQTAKVYLGG